MFERVLVPVDGSPLAAQAITMATSLARLSDGAIELILVHSTPLPHRGKRTATGTPEEHGYVQELARELAWRFNVPVSAHIARGDPAEAIVRRADEVNADLIVMTSHGRTGLSRAWLGSVADGVLREAKVPVLVERPVEGRDWRETPQIAAHKILIPLDGSPLAASVLPPAIAMCKAMQASPVLVRVVYPQAVDVSSAAGILLQPPLIYDDEATRNDVHEAERALAAVASEIDPDGGLKVETAVLVHGSTARGILEMAEKRSVDLIAMATHGRGGRRLVLGSVTDKVVRGTNVPLLLVHPGRDTGRKTETPAAAEARQPA